MRSRGVPLLNVYECDDNEFGGFRVKRFDEYGSEWLEFACRCRRRTESQTQYDIIIGPVADDRVFEAVNMYFQGLWDERTTLDALAFYDCNDQYCFASQFALDELLRFEAAWEVSS